MSAMASQITSITIVCSTLYSGADQTRTTRTPAFWGYPPPPNDYPYHWVILDPKSKEDKVKVTNLKIEFWNGHYTRHTFWSCLIRCANMKWIRWVLLKIQSGHDSVHRRTDGQTDGRTDGQTDKVILVYPPFNFVEAGGIKTPKLRVTGLCEGNSPVTGEFLAKRPVTRKMFPFDDAIMFRAWPIRMATTTCSFQSLDIGEWKCTCNNG